MKKLLVFLFCLGQFANAQINKNAIINSKALINTNTTDKLKLFKPTAVWTKFDPVKNGFKFANTFNGVDASHRYGGLCGGMVYTELDYFYANMPIPQQTYAPSNRYPLQSYIYKRQAKSAQESNADKWAELGVNPGGIRNNEFFGWGIEMMRPGDRMNELKSMIDNGKPAPLGLFHTDDAEKYGYYRSGDHQVLAIGYDFGRYKGDKGQFIEDFKIFILDPNYPNVVKTLVADPITHIYYYLGSDNEAWLTYFVNTKYEKMTPLSIQNLDDSKTLYLKVDTGNDNLRGGNDNLAVTIVYKDGSKQVFPNVNVSATWIPMYCEVVPLNLNRIVTSKADIKQVILECSFSGGIGGENWDMKQITITKNNENNVILNVVGTIPRDGVNIVKRFTGNDRFMTFDIH